MARRQLLRGDLVRRPRVSRPRRPQPWGAPFLEARVPAVAGASRATARRVQRRHGVGLPPAAAGRGGRRSAGPACAVGLGGRCVPPPRGLQIRVESLTIASREATLRHSAISRCLIFHRVADFTERVPSEFRPATPTYPLPIPSIRLSSGHTSVPGGKF